MEYHENRLCISARELVDGGIVSQSNYQNWVNRKRIDVVRRGGGAAGDGLIGPVRRGGDGHPRLRRHVVQGGEAQVDAVIPEHAVQLQRQGIGCAEGVMDGDLPIPVSPDGKASYQRAAKPLTERLIQLSSGCTGVLKVT